MIYFLLSKEKSLIQTEIIHFIKEKIKLNYNYHIIFVETHINDNEIKFIIKDKDIVFWEPSVAHNNLEILKRIQNSIVILEKPTILVQKISKFNYINENMAINHGFFLYYLNPDENDITNSEWKLVIKSDLYLIDSIKLKNIIEFDNTNIKSIENNLSENNINIFSEITEFVKTQINLS
jgi:hypothetical protein